jgi:hypothetical protein
MMNLRWDINKEYGFLDITPREYGEDYFRKYEEYAKTPMGKRLTEGRVAFVDKWYTSGSIGCQRPGLLDIGVGCGQFVEARDNTYGYDINKTAVEMLKASGRYVDVEKKELIFGAYTFWDSFEHIKDHSGLFSRMYGGYFKNSHKKAKIFISIPIFRDVKHALESRHFRTDEHYWYFTAQGLVKYMSDHGFSCLDVDDFENRYRAGREDILSFAFEKR